MSLRVSAAVDSAGPCLYYTESLLRSNELCRWHDSHIATCQEMQYVIAEPCGSCSRAMWHLPGLGHLTILPDII